MGRLLIATLLIFGAISCLSDALESAEKFRFESVLSLNEMHDYLREHVPLGTSKSKVRKRFVEQGRARMYLHPQRSNIEKYVYDINLCKRYVWRWNISANFSKSGKLTQIYMNGEPVHAAGDKLRDPKAAKKPGTKEQILKMKRPRPEASAGERAIAYLLYDVDSSKKQTDDEFIIGGAPSRADPANLGKIKVYKGLERWRTIFDQEPADSIVSYGGKCP